jgi:hypothetical protein
MALTIGGQPTPTTFNRELLTGVIPNSSQFRVSGYNADVGTSREDVWPIGGFYPFLSAGIQMRVVSSSADDTAAGTGARTVRLVYLDSNYDTQYEDITMNGTTPVNTVATNILRIQDMHVRSLGSGTGNAGDIDLTNLAGSTTYCRIAVDINRSRSAIFTVPRGKRAFIAAWRGGTVVDSNNNAFAWSRITLRATTDWELSYLPRIFQHKSQILTVDDMSNITFGVPLAFPQYTDIKVGVQASHAGCVTTAGFEGWVEDAE